jgi:hypothetical protein
VLVEHRPDALEGHELPLLNVNAAQTGMVVVMMRSVVVLILYCMRILLSILYCMRILLKVMNCRS